MKLIERPDEKERRHRVEDLFDVGSTDGKTSRFQRYQHRFKLSVVAPLQIAWDDWRSRFGFFVVLGFLFMAWVWAPLTPRAFTNSAPRLVQPFDWEYSTMVFGIPFWEYPLGTNDVGQPILQRIVNAAPAMVELIIAGAVVSTGVAIFVGTTAGYKGGWIDDILMGITDIMLTIPGLPLVVLLASVFEPRDPFILGMILAIDNWPGLARSLRSQVLTIRQESYVEASRTMGFSSNSILQSDIVPQLMPYVLINAASAGKVVIIEAVGLYFLGFLPSSAPNWGRMLDRAYQFGAITNPEYFYLALWPMVMLALLSFGLVLLAQGLDKMFNPRLRARYSHTDQDE